MTTDSNDTTTKGQPWGSRIRHGRLLSSDFFARHWVTVLAVIMMFLGYITNKYQCQTRMETIQSLQRRLEIVKTEAVLQHSRYMSRTRESAMREMVDTMRLNLSVQERPPFKIERDR
jgi:hypothetical protein